MKNMFFCFLMLFFIGGAVAETKIVDDPMGSANLSGPCKKAIVKATDAKKASVIAPECVPTPPKKEVKK